MYLEVNCPWEGRWDVGGGKGKGEEEGGGGRGEDCLGHLGVQFRHYKNAAYYMHFKM